MSAASIDAHERKSTPHSLASTREREKERKKETRVFLLLLFLFLFLLSRKRRRRLAKRDDYSFDHLFPSRKTPERGKIQKIENEKSRTPELLSEPAKRRGGKPRGDDDDGLTLYTRSTCSKHWHTSRRNFSGFSVRKRVICCAMRLCMETPNWVSLSKRATVIWGSFCGAGVPRGARWSVW